MAEQKWLRKAELQSWADTVPEEHHGVPVAKERGPPPLAGIPGQVEARRDPMCGAAISGSRLVRSDSMSDQHLRVAEIHHTLANLLGNTDTNQREGVPGHPQVSRFQNLTMVVLDHLRDRVLRRFGEVEHTGYTGQVESTLALGGWNVGHGEALAFRSIRIPREHPPHPLRRQGHA
jgi:hypothetical protein